jgi:hypothetical protein
MSQEVIEITEREIEIIEVVEKGPAGPVGPQANINYTVVSSPQTLSNSQNIAADTSGGSFTLTLPANPNAGDSIDIFDYSETFDTNPLTIARNGQRIESLEENLICNVEGAYFTMIYTGSTRGWQILPRYGTSGGGGESILTNQGDTLYRGALVNERLPIGTAGQILKVNSTSTAPEWGAAPATGVTSVTGTAPIASSGGATPAISISAATTSAAGSMSSADKTKLDGIAANANNYTHPNHSGDVTSSGDGATTIANDAVTNAKLANMATATIKGRATASTGDPEDLSASSVRTLLNTDQVSDARTPTSHTHGNITNSGAVGTTANLPLKTGTNGVVEAGSFGTAAGSFCEGNDARLSDARTPSSTLAHAASHAAGVKASSRVLVAGVSTPVLVRANAAGTAGNSITLSFNGVRANFTGQVAGMTNNVTIRALYGGSGYNGTSLSFDGSNSIQDAINDNGQTELVSGNGGQIPDDGESITLAGGSGDTINARLSAWNSANPSNQATLIWGDGSQIPDDGESITLSGGVAGGSDPIPSFSQLAVNDGNGVSLVSLNGASSDIIEFESQELTFQHTGGNGTPYISVTDESNNEALLGLRDGEMFLQGSNPNVRIEQNGGNLANILMASAKLQSGAFFATITPADEELTDNVTLTIPDQSGTLAVVTDIPDFAAPPAIGNTTPAAGTFTTLTANNDTEVTDSTKGLVLKSPNNTRWRITINDDGTLSRVALAIMTLLAFAASGMAQVRDMVTDTNGNIVTGRTNELTFTNNLRFAPLTNANSRTALIGTNGALSAGNPPSGAAANGALLAADGAGSSSFVASRTVTKFTTNDQTKTNWGFNAVTQSTNNDPQMGSWSLDANSFYRVEYAIAWVATTNSGFAHGLGFSTNLSEFNHRSGVGQAANATLTSITSGTNATAIGLANVSAISSGSRFAVAGFVYVLTSSNANTMNYRWYPINNSADATTLIQSSMLSVTKMAP